MISVKEVLSIYFCGDEGKISKIEFLNHGGLDSSDIENISIEQRIGVFSYLYLYKLLSNDVRSLDDILEYLHLTESVIKNCEQFFTEETIENIKTRYKETNAEYIEIFNEPEDDIIELINNIACLPVAETKQILKGLESRQYEHPTDRAAIEKLSSSGMLEKIVKLYSKYGIEKFITIQYTGTNIKVNKNNVPYLHNALKEACRILDIKDVPDLYLDQGFINAFTIGADRPIIILSASCASLLTYDELLFLLGHELGHIKSKHVLYTMIAKHLPGIIGAIGELTPFGIGELLAQGSKIALYDWYKKSEFSADRAGLLACQNLNAAISTMAKLAGFPPQFYDSLNPQDFIEQAKEFDSMNQNTLNKLTNILCTVENTHPWTVMRAHELSKWFEEQDYINILNRNSDVKTIRNEKVKYCSECGAKNEETFKFCISCGESLK